MLGRGAPFSYLLKLKHFYVNVFIKLFIQSPYYPINSERSNNKPDEEEEESVCSVFQI